MNGPDREYARRVRLRWRSSDREEAIDVASDGTVLDAAEAAGVALPFGCRTGACGTCTGRVLAGELVHRRPPRALKARHLDEGYALLCVAAPRADADGDGGDRGGVEDEDGDDESRAEVEVEVGADVATDLVSNPWK